jgi:hypothetical protein
LVEELFQGNTLGHLRRVQGLIRESRKELNDLGDEKGRQVVAEAVKDMRAYDKIRVHYFRELLNHYRVKTKQPTTQIQRKPNNPMLRHTQQSLTFH